MRWTDAAGGRRRCDDPSSEGAANECCDYANVIRQDEVRTSTLDANQGDEARDATGQPRGLRNINNSRDVLVRAWRLFRDPT